MEIAGLVAQRNFNVSATAGVKSKDEVEMLARAFDGMTDGLRERDKVKNLFNKFHGSSVTENLLESGDGQLGGMRKKVCMFFSDIRGFNKFSENRSPEDLVSMLNEYFTVIVTAINRNGVNMASRIESSTKSFGTDLLLSDDLAKSVEGRVILEAAGSVEVKGKSDALKLYKVRGFVLEDGSLQEIKRASLITQLRRLIRLSWWTSFVRTVY